MRQGTKFSPNFTNFSSKIVMLHCVVSGLAKQNMSPQYFVCKETAENGELYQRSGVVHLTAQCATITLSSDWKKIHSEKQNNFVISLFILPKVAAKWQLLTLCFKRTKVKTSHTFATSPDILVAKGKNSVANVTFNYWLQFQALPLP